MNPPRDGKALLVLDLDHTLVDFSSRVSVGITSTNSVMPVQQCGSNKSPFIHSLLGGVMHVHPHVKWAEGNTEWTC